MPLHIYKTGTWNNLRSFNRPAVIELQDTAGGKHHVLVAELTADAVSLVIGGQPHEFPVSEVGRYWFGKYLLLWKPPMPEQEMLRLGDRGDAVIWLRDALARYRGEPLAAESSEIFDKELRHNSGSSRVGTGSCPTAWRDGSLWPSCKTICRANRPRWWPTPEPRRRAEHVLHPGRAPEVRTGTAAWNSRAPWRTGAYVHYRGAAVLVVIGIILLLFLLGGSDYLAQHGQPYFFCGGGCCDVSQRNPRSRATCCRTGGRGPPVRHGGEEGAFGSRPGGTDTGACSRHLYKAKAQYCTAPQGDDHQATPLVTG
jgi:hypothetical protein